MSPSNANAADNDQEHAETLLTTNELKNLTCAALLAEPGMGKTSELLEIERQLRIQGTPVLKLDLLAVDALSDVRGELMRARETHAFLEQNNRMALLLDGLDELMTSNGRAGAALAGTLRELAGPAEFSEEAFKALIDAHAGLEVNLQSITRRESGRVLVDAQTIWSNASWAKELPEEARQTLRERQRAHRLQLFIACRTAEWPITLQSVLEELWPSQVTLMTLNPLTQEDVKVAALSRNVAIEEFAAALRQVNGEALVERPITLEFLLTSFQRGGQLPHAQADLYGEGCRLLCEEQNDQRLDAALQGNLSADQRLTIAKRLAALTLFCDRATWLTRTGAADLPSASLRLRDATGGRDGHGGGEVEVSEANLLETLRTALFNSVGPHRLGWTHRTYAEFLAAAYLNEAGIDRQRLLTLLTQPGTNGRVAPPLREVAAWLGVLQPELGRELAQRDAQALLYAAALPHDNQGKALLVEALLRDHDEDRAPSLLNREAVYTRLNHPDLATQLQTCLLDPMRSDKARYVAARLATATRTESLWPILLGVALDPDVALLVRKGAAYATRELMPAHERMRLKPLTQVHGPDTEELRGIALQALWPEHLTLQELLASLTKPQHHGLTAYNYFLRYLPPWHFVDDADLPDLLAWLTPQAPGAWLLGQADDYASVMWRGTRAAVVLRVWKSLEQPGILNAFADLWGSSVLSPYGLSVPDSDEANLVNTSPARRRSVVARLVHRHQQGLVWLSHSKAPWLLPEDAGWVLEQVDATESTEERARWRELAVRLAYTPEMQMAMIGRVLPTDLAEDFAAHLAPVEPDPEFEAQLQAVEQRQAKQAAQAAARPNVQESVRAAIEGVDDGQATAWLDIPEALNVDAEGLPVWVEPSLGLSSRGGWTLLDDELKSEIKRTARAFITHADLRSYPVTTLAHLYAVVALRFLLEEDEAFITQLSKQMWEKWIPSILTHLPLGDAVAQDMRLLREANRGAPKAFLVEVKEIILRNKRGDLWMIRRIRSALDIDALDLITEVVKSQEDLSVLAVRSLLDVLLETRHSGARQLAETLMDHPGDKPDDTSDNLSRDDSSHADDLPPPATGWQRAVQAAAALVTHEDDAAWKTVWEAIMANKAFGLDLALNLVPGFGNGNPNVADKLNEADLAGLFAWLEKCFPAAEDPQHDDGTVYSPTFRDEVGEWRDSLLDALARRGTVAAVEALEQLETALPTRRAHLRRALAIATDIWMQQTWVPLQPNALLAVTRSRHNTLVRDGKELLDVVVDALRDLQAEFQGENYSAPELWNVVSSGARPKDEEAISDHVKRSLHRALVTRGVVVNREVQIRRKVAKEGAPGEEIDLYITAVTHDSREQVYGTAKVIVEVKGAWNKEVKTAMEKQLVDRYLSDNDVQHGLYIVAWPECAAWDKSDYRREGAPRWSAEKAREFFDNQADSLSKKHNVDVRAIVLDIGLR